MLNFSVIFRSRLSSARHWLRCLAITLSVWLAVAGTTFAQKGKPEPEEPKGYFLSYTLLVLCLVLGAYCTARPSKRTGEVRKQVEEE
jgi:Na+/melibiose symporter-like transporter